MSVRSAAAGAALAAAMACGAAQAQNQAVIRDPDYDALFQRVLREPGNLDLSFRFAETATRLGDYEAAIGALERMVFYNPNLPRVRLELGVLYFRLGSYEMARSYFESAIAAPDTPADVRVRVSGFLAEIDRRVSVTQWSFFGQAGLRHQSNANAGPTSQLVRAAGVDATLDRQFVRAPDWNAFGLGGIRHVYDFENQRGDVWETTVGAYYAKQFKFEKLNLGLIEVQTGPRLALLPDSWPGFSIRPYALANGVSLGDDPYLTTTGAGVGVTMPISPYFNLEPFLEVRARKFGNNKDYPNAAEQSGRLWTAGLLAQGDLFWGSAVRWQARAAFARNDTRRDYTSYEAVGIDVGFPMEFQGPWGARKWTVIPSAGYGRTYYDAQNFIIDPITKRVDREWRAGVLVDMPVYEWVGFAAQVQYAYVDSTLRNYDTRNLSVVFGPTVRF
ncbi:MAG TPA: tetratricopeptide repeat protein [Beijerinckiaceae bacterium]|jgi:tetratricopeptide (TPR) repeat protein